MKGQAWVQDAVLSIAIIIFAFAIFMVGYNNLVTTQEFDDIYEENELISEYLMLEGTPSEWNESNVIRIGILNSDHSINDTKLDLFRNLTKSNYDNSRSLLNTRFDFFIFFTDNQGNYINILNETFIGKTDINDTNLLTIDTESIAKTERYVIKKIDNSNFKEIIRLNVYSWEEG
ncbi:hypothetical protein C0585_00770 [Candidatus Woesearchaeota archaeon]|nr:MAG: hypothetical protein C0585_00770 [Candidatus Woesearchaeota archaeon]